MDQLAFAGAEGYGATAVGGRGGRVVTVTNLNDSGIGSLRWALEDVPGPRTVVFAVNGAIQLTRQIVILDPYVTVAGQTAPGGGIVLEGGRINVHASEVIIRGLTIRPGDASRIGAADLDGLFIGTTDYEIKNIIVDHSSVEWALDENLSINGNVKNVTLSNNIIAQGLSRSVHPNGEHSKGSLISNSGSLDPAYDARISIVKNLYAHNFARNPEIRAGQEIEVVNNWMYNYGLSHLVLAVGAGNGGTLATTVNAIGNVFTPGPSSQDYKMPIHLSAMGAGSAIYLQDNLWTKIATDVNGDQDQAKLVSDSGGARHLVAASTIGSGAIDILDAQEVVAYIAANVGARPFDPDVIDDGIVRSAINGTGTIVDSVAQAGGQVVQQLVAAAADTDADGMPDWFEGLYGFNARAADSAGDADGDGYTNLEEYINGIYTGFDAPIAGPMAGVEAAAGMSDIVALDGAGSGTVVSGFNFEAGDRIDLSASLGGYDPDSAPLSDFVQIIDFAGDTIITVDRDGVGNDHTWQYAALLSGIAGLDGRYDILTQSYLTRLAPGQVFAGTQAFERVVATGPAGDAAISVDTAGGDDIIVIEGTAMTGVVDGGEGIDRLIVRTDKAADLSAIAIRNIEVLQANVAITATAEQVAGFRSVEAATSATRLELTVTTPGLLDFSMSAPGRAVYLTASGGDDAIVTTDAADVVRAGGGADIVHAGAGTDIVDGGDQADMLYGGDGADTIDGGEGNDQLYGGLGKDVLTGGAGSDILIGGGVGPNGGADTLRGGSGADIYYVLAQDAINERFGQLVDDGAIDLVYAIGNRTLAQFVDNVTLLGTENFAGTGNVLANVIIGNAGKNRLLGNDGDDTLFGMDGDDVIEGGADDDRLDGGAGYDLLAGGLGDDTYVISDGDTVLELLDGGYDVALASIDTALADNVEELRLVGDASSGTGNVGDNRLVGSAGDDLLAGLAGADIIDGGAGRDLASYAESLAGVTIDLGTGAMSGGDADGDILIDIEGLVGSAQADSLTGNASDNALFGGGGDDALFGGEGGDRLDGGFGSDLLAGGAGDDTYIIGDFDRIIEAVGGGRDTVVASYDYSLEGDLEDLTFNGAANLVGVGNGLANAITGNDGANLLIGGLGGDWLDGGTGVDTAGYAGSAARVIIDLAAGTGLGGDAEGDRLLSIENLIGSAFADLLTGDGRDNLIVGGAGGDTLAGGNGIDTIDYGASTAAVKVSLANGAARQIGGTAQNDVLSGFENIAGSAFNDTLTGDIASNRLDGGAGNDILDGGRGGDLLVGGAGDDRYIVDDVGDVVVEAAGGGNDMVAASVSYVLGSAVEQLTLLGDGEIDGTGNALSNQITGNMAANAIDGAEGADSISAGAGNDRVLGGTGSDIIDGGTGADLLFGDGDDDLIAGGAGADEIRGGTGADRIDGGDDDDFLYGDIDKDTLNGGAGNDRLDGGDADDALAGGIGNDLLIGGAGSDKLDGGIGADTMEGGAGKDFYWVDDLGDLVADGGLDGAVDSVLSSVDFVLGGDLENLTLLGEAPLSATGNDLINRVVGNAGANVIDVGGGADIVNAGDGADTVIGGSGTDRLFGEGGDDILSGGVGSDYLSGGLGRDVMTGGSSRDSFAFASAGESTLDTSDVITDFDVTDVIDLSGMDADDSVTGRQTFTFIGTAEFTAAGQARYFVDGNGDTIVQANTNDTLGADLQIILAGVPLPLNAGDFLM